MKKIQAIIFDMDGVIADSEPLHFEAEKAILQQHGIEAPWSEWDRFTGLTEERIFQYIIDHFTDGGYTPQQLIQAKYGIFLQLLTEKLTPIAGSLEFIQWARTHVEKLALTTSSLREVQQTVFRLFDLNAYFDVVVTGDQIQHGKPHPEPYLCTAEALHFAPSECLVIEDSLNGVKSAKDAGCRVAAITTSFQEAALRDAGADMVVHEFRALHSQL